LRIAATVLVIPSRRLQGAQKTVQKMTIQSKI
jgi:hypothetical protein